MSRQVNEVETFQSVEVNFHGFLPTQFVSLPPFLPPPPESPVPRRPLAPGRPLRRGDVEGGCEGGTAAAGGQTQPEVEPRPPAPGPHRVADVEAEAGRRVLQSCGVQTDAVLGPAPRHQLPRPHQAGARGAGGCWDQVEAGLDCLDSPA